MKPLNLLNPLRTLALAAVMTAMPWHPASAADADAATSQARATADAAHEALVDRYRMVWASLGKQQKAVFAQRERAWLNEGRSVEELRCIEQPSAHAPALAAQLCRLKVTEQRLAALPIVQTEVVSAR